MAKEGKLIRLGSDGELQNEEQKPTPRFQPLRGLRERREQQRVQKKAQQEADEWNKRIEKILTTPIKIEIDLHIREVISKVFSNNSQKNRRYLYEIAFEEYDFWTDRFRIKTGPEFLLALNTLLQPDQKEGMTTALSIGEVASSPLLPLIIEEQYKKIEQMGYSRDSEDLGITYDEILASAQEHLIEWYNGYVDTLNRRYLCSYGNKMKRKRS